MTMVTRFAPSPTGYLHVGSARTALYCWLYAKKTEGKFILRIEDTDRERSTDASVQAILDSMAWLGLNYDEGPIYQTKRFDRYRAVSEQLLQEEKAYRCYCSKERLEELRNHQIEHKEKPRYDGRCRNKSITSEDPFVIRFRNPTEGMVEFDDLIRGKRIFNNTELDDLIIMRSDGTPTYNFTVVVDDWDMHITHVIRGDDHINNTPRQINILRALDASVPFYAHVPMILGKDGKRLSKRHGAVGVMQYREEGFLPDALLNYLARLGWSHGDQEIFSRAELIELFNIDRINHSPAAFDPDKLIWLNQHYIKTSDPEVVSKELAWHMQSLAIPLEKGPSLVDIIRVQAPRVKTLREMAEKSRYFYEDIHYNQEAFIKHFVPSCSVMALLKHDFDSLEEWSEGSLHRVMAEAADRAGIKLGSIAQPLRVAVTGDVVSPPIDATLALLGREKTLTRLTTALELGKN